MEEDTVMRPSHIIGGLIAFATGLFFCILNTAAVIPTFKGFLHPATIFLGLCALCAALLGKREFRSINAIVSGILLFIGLFGLYDDFLVVVAFLHGAIPLFCIAGGTVSIIYGLKKIG